MILIQNYYHKFFREHNDINLNFKDISYEQNSFTPFKRLYVTRMPLNNQYVAYAHPTDDK